MIDDGVPATDVGGAPALAIFEAGSPASFGGLEDSTRRFSMTLYRQSFVRQWDDDAYDVDEEILETIEHELDHYLGTMEGHDALGETEIAEARSEIRELYGDRRLLRMALREARAELVAFVRFAWPFAVLIVLGVLLADRLGWLW